MGESIRVAGMYFSHFFVYFMYGSFFMVAHATLQVSASVICHCKRLVCTCLFKKMFLGVCFFQVSEHKSEEWMPPLFPCAHSPRTVEWETLKGSGEIL